jgi:hypothetical protein
VDACILFFTTTTTTFFQVIPLVLFEGLVVDKAGSIFGHLELTFLDLLAKLHVAAWAPSGAIGDLKKSRQGMSKRER